MCHVCNCENNICCIVGFCQNNLVTGMMVNVGGYIQDRTIPGIICSLFCSPVADLQLNELKY